MMIMPEEVKRCTVCKSVKSLSEFWSEKLQRHGKTCARCREVRARSYRRRKAERGEEPLVGRPPGQPLLSGELAGEHDLLGLPPATLTVIPARPRPCDAGQRWLAVR
jgi:hypothetical protein